MGFTSEVDSANKSDNSLLLDGDGRGRVQDDCLLMVAVAEVRGKVRVQVFVFPGFGLSANPGHKDPGA